MLRKYPLVVILGSTATGKTKLSIELARRFRGEIISADSMQIYKGLDISTAKATKEEQSQAVHHLLDIREPCSRKDLFHVVEFRDTALPIIDRLLHEEKIPIIVGGTNYYIESVLWKVLVNPPLTDGGPKRKDEEGTESGQAVKKPKIGENAAAGLPNASDESTSASNQLHLLTPDDLIGKDPDHLYGLLSEVDPASAQRLHPNDERKVRRALEVYMKLGQRISDIHAAQRTEEGASYLGGPLRYEHVILFWIKSDQDVLNARIDKRIDGMVAQGLLQEIRQFHKDLITAYENEPLDCTKGMMQAIGFKEFIPYLEKYPESLDAEITEFIKSGGNSESPGEKPDGIKTLEECLDTLRLRTKRYSKGQIKWVTNRFISTKGRHVPPVYVLDSTQAETQWDEDVFLPAEDVVECYLNDKTPKLQPVEAKQNPRTGLNENVTHFCEDCDRRFIGDYQWELHRKSNKHKKVVATRKWYEAYKKQQELKKGRGLFTNFGDFFRRIGAILAKFWPF